MRSFTFCEIMAKKKPATRKSSIGRAKPIRRRLPKPTVRALAETRDLSTIKPRLGDPTRGINLDHVADLAESIHVLGLIQPIAIDADGHVIAGGHRHVAMQVLASEDRAVTAMGLIDQKEVDKITRKPLERLSNLPSGTGEFDIHQVPVRVYPIRTADAKTKALAMEIAENEKRKDYTPAEALAFHRRLVKAGYHDDVGAPKAGKVSATKAVSTVVGKNERTIRRWQKKARDKEAMAEKMSEDEIRTYVLIEREKKDRQHLRQSALRYLKNHSETLDKSTRDAIDILLAHLNRT